MRVVVGEESLCSRSCSRRLDDKVWPRCQLDGEEIFAQAAEGFLKEVER